MVHDIDDVIDKISVNSFHYWLLMLCGVGFCVDAMEVVALSFINPCAGAEFNLDDSEIASITSSVFAGQIIGTLFWGPFADVYGRRISFISSSITVAIGGWASGFAGSYISLLLMRFIVGLGVGGATVPFDIFAEFLPRTVRGKLLNLTNLFWTFGELYLTLAAYIFIPTKGWRPLAFAAAAPVTLAVFFAYYILPESPRWLIQQKRFAEAEEIVHLSAENSATKPGAFTFGTTPVEVELPSVGKAGRDGAKANANIDTSDSLTPYARICKGISDAILQYAELWKDPELRITTIKIGSIWLVFGFTYYGIVLLITRIYQEGSSASKGDNAVCSFDYGGIAFNETAEIMGWILSTAIIDMAGRRGTQMSTYFIGSVTLILLAMLPHATQTTVVVLSYMSRMAAMASSCTTWVMTPELYPTRVRATAHSLVNTFARVGALVSPFLVISSLSILDVALVLGAVNMIAVASAWSLRETAGEALDKIEKEENTEENNVSPKMFDNPLQQEPHIHW